MTHHKSKLHTQSFYAGILSALAIIAIHDERTLFDEIVSATGAIELVETARKDGVMRWRGLSKYGYGKNRT
jgi:tetrahydromethanopterin S-methyltransferase subunit A